MTLTYDLFWSFRSPYSYLVTPRLLEFEGDFDVKANVRPVYPIAVRIDGFFNTVNPLWWSYLPRRGACGRNAGPAILPAKPGSNRDGPEVRRGFQGTALYWSTHQARRCCCRAWQGARAS